MKRFIALVAGLLALSAPSIARDSGSTTHVAYLGFDRNDYPGDSSLKLLRSKFSFAGFWLNNPPGANSNSWTGKRRVAQELGFGFLVVFNGRTFAQIKEAADATKLGASDGRDGSLIGTPRRISRRNDYFSRPRRRGAAAPRAAELSSRLGRCGAIRRF